MSINIIIKRFILLSLLSIWSFTSVLAQGFSNPISNHSPEDFADPSVVYYNGNYYGVNSENGSSQIAIYKSKSFKDLYISGTKKIVHTAPLDTNHSQAIWAPFLQNIRGDWYIYYTASYGNTEDEVRDNHRMFVLKLRTSNGQIPDLQGSYEHIGKIYASNTDFYAIDGKVIVKPNDNSLYFVWSGSSMLPAQDIYIAPMSNPTTISGLAVRISGTVASWENEVHESTDFIYKNGKSILSYSTGRLLDGGPNGYKTGTLTNTDGDYLNPNSWVKSPNAVFKYYRGTDGEVHAPGATRFIKSPDGTEDWLVYHAKHFGNNGVYNREIRAQKFTWDRNDNPLFGNPIPSGVFMPVPSGEVAPTETVFSGNYKIISKHSSNAVTVTSDSLAVGAKIEQRSFTGRDSQIWIITKLENGFYKIISKNSQLALAIKSVDNGAILEQQTFTNTDNDNQLWKISSVDDGSYVISSKLSQKSVHLANNAVTAGGKIDQWPFQGYPTQKWTLVRN